MNERIKELVKQAGFFVLSNGKIYIPTTSEEITDCQIKFAHLIIQECVEICRKGINNATDWDSSYWDQACENRAETIRQHFGVTE